MSEKNKNTLHQKDALQALHALAYSETAGKRQIKRARMVLACIHGETTRAVADRFQTPASTVAVWCDRFARSGVNGLLDKPRSGRPIRYNTEFRTAVLQLLDEPPPTGRDGWNGASISEHLQVSATAVSRLLRKEGICLSQHNANTHPPRYLAQRTCLQQLLAVEPEIDQRAQSVTTLKAVNTLTHTPKPLVRAFCLERIAYRDGHTEQHKKTEEVVDNTWSLQRLQMLAQHTESDLRLADRARMVLAAIDAQPIREIARSFKTSGYTVRFWLNRFKSSGVFGLLDMPRSGRPPVIGRLALGKANRDIEERDG